MCAPDGESAYPRTLAVKVADGYRIYALMKRVSLLVERHKPVAEA